MNIDTREVIAYIDLQTKTMQAIGAKTPFMDGIINGLNLVRTYIALYEDRQGNLIAEALDGNKS